LLPELYFPAYRRAIPGLKLAVLVRDPLETVVASAFWRGGSSPPRNLARTLAYHGWLWRLSVRATQNLIRDFPEDVRLVDSATGVPCGKAECPPIFPLAPLPRVEAASIPWYSHRVENGVYQFLTPQGDWHSLLPQADLRALLAWRGRYWPLIRSGSAPDDTLLQKVLWAFALKYPGLTKKVLDVAYNPCAWAMRHARRAVRCLARRTLAIERPTHT
jgi:hypothetical protein